MSFIAKTLALYDCLVAKLAKIDWLPPLVARITVGMVMMQSGWGKLNSLPKVVEYFRGLGIPAPELQAPFAAANEFVCGVALIVGLFTRLASIPLVAIMVVAIITAKRDELHSLDDLFGFIEYLYIVILFYLIVRGPGPVSLDRLLFKLRPKAEPAAKPSVDSKT